MQIFVSQQLLFLFSKHLDAMSNVTDYGTGSTDLCLGLSLLYPYRIHIGMLHYYIHTLNWVGVEGGVCFFALRGASGLRGLR